MILFVAYFQNWVIFTIFSLCYIKNAEGRNCKLNFAMLEIILYIFFIFFYAFIYKCGIYAVIYMYLRVQPNGGIYSHRMFIQAFSFSATKYVTSYRASMVMFPIFMYATVLASEAYIWFLMCMRVMFTSPVCMCTHGAWMASHISRNGIILSNNVSSSCQYSLSFTILKKEPLPPLPRSPPTNKTICRYTLFICKNLGYYIHTFVPQAPNTNLWV